MGIASAVEGAALFVAINVLTNIGARDLFAPVAAIIVGLHFLPLARGLPAPLYYATGVAIAGIGVLGFAIADVSQRILAVSMGAAGALWITAAIVLLTGPRPA